MNEKNKVAYRDIHGQVAKLVLSDLSGEWKISHFLSDAERLKIVADSNCVRPQQAAAGDGMALEKGRGE